MIQFNSILLYVLEQYLNDFPDRSIEIKCLTDGFLFLHHSAQVMNNVAGAFVVSNYGVENVSDFITVPVT